MATTDELKKKYGPAYNPLNGLVSCVLHKRVDSCNAGEIAGFDPDTAEKLVAADAAEIWEPNFIPAPVPAKK